MNGQFYKLMFRKGQFKGIISKEIKHRDYPIYTQYVPSYPPPKTTVANFV